MMEWKEVRLGDVYKIKNGYAFSSKDLLVQKEENCWEVLKIGHIAVEGGLRVSPKREYARKTEKNSNYVLHHHDIVMGMTDMKSNVKILGIPAVVDKSDHYALNQRVACLRLQRNDLADNVFCYYQMLHDRFINDLRKTANSGVQVNLTTVGIASTPLYLPDLSTQRRIASILSSLDRKIELNNKINAQLEEMAQAIFKSWFVDFEPFKDGKFVESELGMIPEGWRVSRAEEVYNINIGKTPPRKESQWFSNNPDDNIWVSIADMGTCGMFISNSSEYLTNEAITKHNVQMVEKNTVLLSFKLTVGRVTIADEKLTTNEAIARFCLPNDNHREYLYLMLKRYDYNSLGSTSSIATAVNSKTIKGMKLLIPSDTVLAEFNNKIKPIFERIRTLSRESLHLSQLRDTLLPKLMNGEIEL